MQELVEGLKGELLCNVEIERVIKFLEYKCFENRVVMEIKIRDKCLVLAYGDELELRWFMFPLDWRYSNYELKRYELSDESVSKEEMEKIVKFSFVLGVYLFC